ncbi:MAG: hypothetical protein PVF17_10660 [Ignavibacteria bacterium]|jgi:hypothetical protein
MVEDRAEVRLLRNRINNTITSLAISSFAITAFLLDKRIIFEIKLYSTVIDVMIILIMAFAFWRLMIDLGWVRTALELREKLIRDLEEKGKTFEVDPLPLLEAKNKSHITDDDMKWVFAFGITIMVLKIAAVWFFLP